MGQLKTGHIIMFKGGISKSPSILYSSLYSSFFSISLHLFYVLAMLKHQFSGFTNRKIILIVIKLVLVHISEKQYGRP